MDCAGGLLLGGLSRSPEDGLGGVDTGVGSNVRSRSMRCLPPLSDASVRSTYLLQLATFCAVRGEWTLDGGVSKRPFCFFDGEGECRFSPPLDAKSDDAFGGGALAGLDDRHRHW